MKCPSYFTLTMLWLTLADFAADTSPAPTPAVKDGSMKAYTLAWADEFNGTNLDAAKWEFRTDSKHWSTQKPENVEVSGGRLKLHVKKEDAGGKHYTGAGVISKAAFRYGYYETRMKVPPGAGWHTSFWMMLHDGEGGTGTKVACQELDVIENDSGHKNHYGVNIHKWKGGHVSFGGKKVNTPDLAANFHVFGCEFTPTRVKYFCDGELVQSVDVTKAQKKDGELVDFEHGDQNVWLTTIASHLGGTKAVDDNSLPAFAEFDYVRFFSPAKSGNPVFPGWYADPEGAVFGDRFWIYPTYSAPYNQQVFFDAFSSPDLVTWTKHTRILDTNAVTWAHRAMWAPAVIEKGGRYFLFFGANDIQNDRESGGIGVAVADRPEGPFKDYLGKPLIDRFHNSAQPIDQFVFRDHDGQHYLIYGGWRHCNIALLKDDFRGFDPFPDGMVFREITPESYVEGPFIFRRDGKYYFMWSEGGWTGPDYSVAYAIADSPLGPFKRIGKILQQDPQVASGAGHHSVIKLPGQDVYYIVYHRRLLGETDGNHRVTCVDLMEFDDEGFIKPVKITFEGVDRVSLQLPIMKGQSQ